MSLGTPQLRSLVCRASERRNFASARARRERVGEARLRRRGPEDVRGAREAAGARHRGVRAAGLQSRGALAGAGSGPPCAAEAILFPFRRRSRLPARAAAHGERVLFEAGGRVRAGAGVSALFDSGFRIVLRAERRRTGRFGAGPRRCGGLGRRAGAGVRACARGRRRCLARIRIRCGVRDRRFRRPPYHLLLLHLLRLLVPAQGVARRLGAADVRRVARRGWERDRRGLARRAGSARARRRG